MNKLPPHIRPTKYPRYYIDDKGNAYREPLSTGGRASKMPINEYGLVYMKPHYRGGRGPQGRYNSINISLYDESGKFLKQIKKFNHQLVAETFLDNPHGYNEVDHKDRNKFNNSVENLRWVTRKENMDNAPLHEKTYTVIDTRTNRHWQGINLNEWIRENCDWIYLRQRKNSIHSLASLNKGLHGARKKNGKIWGLICTY